MKVLYGVFIGLLLTMIVTAMSVGAIVLVGVFITSGWLLKSIIIVTILAFIADGIKYAYKEGDE